MTMTLEEASALAQSIRTEVAKVIVGQNETVEHLLIALIALVIAWRGVRRFGAARAEVPAIAHGKTQLAANGARLLQRAKRWHLLGAPYADMVAARIAVTLGIRTRDPAERAAAIDRVLMAETGQARFAETAAALRSAERPQDILRAARDLRDIERTLHR